MSDTIYAVLCNQTASNLVNTPFFRSREGAETHLKELAKKRRYNMGVQNWKEDDASFSFTLGWEEHFVKFSIVELPIHD